MKLKKILACALALTLVCSSGCKKPAAPAESESGSQAVTAANTEAVTTEAETTEAATTEPETEPFRTGTHYSVSTCCDEATKVGMKILEKGGNAVDAAIAISYALGVAEPYASGLGGSGNMLIYDSKTGKAVFYDYRAQSGASKEPNKIGIPGMVAGMELIHDDFATMSMEDLIEPAYKLAEEGFTCYGELAKRLRKISGVASKLEAFKNSKGNLVSSGQKVVQKELAKTLKLIQKEGKSAFYEGAIADQIADKTGLTKKDLAQYQAYKYDALEASFYGYKAFSTGSPTSGAMLLQMLEMTEILDMPTVDKNPAKYAKNLETITKKALSERFYNTGDPAFTETAKNEQKLLSNTHICDILNVAEKEFIDSAEECLETTGFCVVDSNGMVVSGVNTISDSFGSRKCVAGIFLNNTNQNFSSSGINTFEPYKRSRSFTAPVILAGADGYVLSVGCPGGKVIPLAEYNVIEKVLRMGMSPQKAVSSKRWFYSGGFVIESGASVNASKISGSRTKPSSVWFGTVSLAGYSKEDGAFAAYDSRRGATMCGVVNED